MSKFQVGDKVKSALSDSVLEIIEIIVEPRYKLKYADGEISKHQWYEDELVELPMTEEEAVKYFIKPGVSVAMLIAEIKRRGLA